jgi:hypothetical protein
MVALLLAFVLIGVAALIIDVGLLYAQRRSMVTAADAAALGGAMVLEEALSDPDKEPMDPEVKTKAEKIAKDLAIANGVKNQDDIIVDFIYNPDIIGNTIRVQIKNNYELFFAKIFGIKSADVAAKAVATWGYITKLEGGDILPIFTNEDDYLSETLTYLHDDKMASINGETVGGNWGLLNIYSNASLIYDAFAGENVDMKMELNYVLDNKTGVVVGNVTNAIEERMQTANKLSDKESKVRFMSGLVPIIDWDKITIQGSTLKLPILYFAVFEIYDVIVSGVENDNGNSNKKSTGSKYALNDTLTDSDDYVSDGIAKEYEKVNGSSLEKSTIIGRFTGERVDIRAILVPGDQVNPNPDVISATYSKLIE